MGSEGITMADSVLDVASLDTAASAVESTVDTAPETEAPAVEVDTADTTDKTTANAEDKSISADTASAPITSDKITEALQKLDPAMAKALHNHTQQSLATQKFLKETGVKDFAELARIIHIFEDNKSLLCYKHVD
jgi:hypothetical protein